MYLHEILNAKFIVGFLKYDGNLKGLLELWIP